MLIEKELHKWTKAELVEMIRAVQAAGGDVVVQWAKKMQDVDRVGFLDNKELAELRGKS